MGKIKKEENEEETVVKKIKFTKAQLVSSKKYSASRDIIQAVLADDKMYSIEEVENEIEKFKKGKVN